MISPLGHPKILSLLPELGVQSFLFTGPEGVGRRTVARWFTYLLNCTRGLPPCGNCASCLLDPHPDFLLVEPDKDTKSGKTSQKPQIRLEQIAPRQEGEPNLLDWASTYPRYRAKLAVVDGAHLLNEAAANALLKLLEEPPGYLRLVLVAPSRELVLPTLASRSTEIPFAPLPASLMETLTPDPRVLAFAGGAPGKALWALNHPAEFSALNQAASKVLEALETGPNQSFLALKELLEVEGGLAYFSTMLHHLFPLGTGARAAALEAILRTEEALASYVSTDLVVTQLAQKLWRLAKAPQRV